MLKRNCARWTAIAVVAIEAAVCTAATAGDLVDGPSKYWTGFYAGVNVGGAFGVTNDSLSVPAGSNVNSTAAANFVQAGTGSYSPSAFTGGLTLGYNYQFGKIVAGLEGDLNYLGLNESRIVGGGPPFGIRVDDNVSGNWMATARARLGYAVDRTLFFATAGASFSNINFRRFNDDNVDGCLPAVGGGFGRCHSGSAKFSPGLALGGGVEHAINKDWTAKLEYIHTDFGHVAFSTTSTAVAGQVLDNSANLNFSTIRIGLNHKF